MWLLVFTDQDQILVCVKDAKHLGPPYRVPRKNKSKQHLVLCVSRAVVETCFIGISAEHMS